MRKLFTMLLAIIMAMTMIPFVGTQKTKADLRVDGVSGRKTAEDYGLQEPRIQNGVTIWDTVFFGNYPQSRKGSNDFNNEPIKWRVLEIEDNTAYMIADKILDSYKYNLEQEVTKWGISPLRSWLGNTFYNKAFNEEEKQDIYHAIVKTAYNSSWYGSGVEITWERALAPSYYDPQIQRFGFDTNPKREHNTRYAKVTDYSASKGVPHITDNGAKKNNGIWMTRSDNSRFLPRWVDSNGKMFDSNGVFDWIHIRSQIKKSGAKVIGVRPTIHLDLSTTNWKYAGTVKSNGEVNEVSDAQNPNEVETPQGEFISVEDLDNPVMEDGVSTWDCVYYGKYPQTLGSDGKFKNEPVKWRVLSKDGNDLFLMADKALDARFFQDSKIKTTWENSETRRYINKYLLNRLFTSRELENVKLSKVNTPKNPKNGRSGGGDTEDKLYLLSYQEIENSDFGFDRKYDQTTSTRSIYTSDYAYYKRTNQRRNVANTELTYWYLRSPGVYDINIGIVHPNGYSDVNGTMVHYGKDYMVPVMHLDANNAKIKYAGTVSSDGKETTGKYKVGGKFENNLRWILNFETGVLTISGNGGMKAYEIEGDGSNCPWSKYRQHIKKVVVKEGVRSIGHYLFRGSKNLEEVQLGKDVTIVRRGAFENCENLTSVYLPDRISNIETNAFDGCSSEVTFDALFDSYGPKYCSENNYKCNIRYEKRYGDCGINGSNVKWELDPERETIRFYGSGEMRTWYNVGREYDKYREYIKNVIIEEGITNVGGAAFYSYKTLKTVSLPNSLKSIDVAAFQQSSLTSIVIPNNVTKIDSIAFHECWWLAYVYIGDKVNSIHERSFERCSAGYSVLKNSYADRFCTERGMRVVERR